MQLLDMQTCHWCSEWQAEQYIFLYHQPQAGTQLFVRASALMYDRCPLQVC